MSRTALVVVAALLAWCSGCAAPNTSSPPVASPSVVFESVGCGRIEFNEVALHAAAAAGFTPDRAIHAEAPHASFTEPRSVLKFILSSAPARAFVYPTERYYYYYFPLGPRLVSGNIRFADAEKGGLSIGYFDTHNEREMQTQEFHDGQNGVHITFRPAEHEVVLAVDGIERTFVLDQQAFEPPVFPLLNGEELVSGVRDESGYFLHLIYWRPGRSFYYVLNPIKPLPETWSRGESKKVEVW